MTRNTLDFSSSGPERPLDARDPRPEARAQLADWLALQAALSLSPVRALECLEASGGDPARALRRSGQGALVSDSELESWLDVLAKNAIRALPVTAACYPPQLRVLPDPPPLLLLRGELPDWRRPAVAIVGARAATRYGLAVAEELARGLASAGAVVVSGLARGVDASAHRGALAEGSTWAVLGCGPDILYPAEHRKLADRVAASGAILTELPPGRPPAAHHFPLRNRIISGLVQAVVVVEARLRSGSLITARHALAQGREVLVVPGAIDSPTSAGTNALLRDGARPVLGVEDVFEALGDGLTPGISPPRVGQAAATPDDPELQRVLEALRHEPLEKDALQRLLGTSARELSLRLVELELDGFVCRDRDGRFRVAPARGMG